MTYITRAELPSVRGKCPMCGSDIRYTRTTNDNKEKAWRCTGCNGYGYENQTGEGPLHHDLSNAYGVSIVLLEP